MKVKRIYVEKKREYAVKAAELQEEIRKYLGIPVTGVRVLVRYDIEKLSDQTYEKALGTVFSEPPVDILYEEDFAITDTEQAFSVEYLPGQFDQRADSAEQCVKLLNEEEEPVIRSATTYVIDGRLSQEELERIKNHCINPVDSREAAKDTLDIMQAHRAGEIGGVVHCFSYAKEMAREYLNMDFYFGIGGVITFKNAKKLKEAVQYIPMDKILLETDSPYLSPEPYRGERNSSLNLPFVAEAIAELKGVSCEAVVEATERNARRLFGL